MKWLNMILSQLLSINLGDIPLVNNIAIGLTIFVPISAFLLWINRKKIDIFEIFFCRKIKIYRKGYYTSPFLVKRINRAKQIVRIFCVRNIRISEPDIIKCMREFCSRGGQVELFVMDPSLSDSVIKKIMVTLPTEPSSVDEYREQVALNAKRIMQMKKDLGMEGDHVRYYEYDMLPTMHFCQFDNKIYLGYQIFDNKDDKNRKIALGDYCSIISVRSTLGKLILEQIEFLQKENKLKEKQP